MTRDEIKTALRIIMATYPNSYRDNAQLKDAISVWSVIFAADSRKEVESALYTYINEGHEFAPNPGQLRAIMRSMTDNGELSEIDAWNLVQRAISNGIYGAEKEFDLLPEDVQKAIGSPSWIHNVAMDEDANMSVESSNFFRRYREVIERKHQVESMPPAVRKMIEGIEKKKGISEAAMLEDKRRQEAEDYERRRQKSIEGFLNPEPREETVPVFARLQELKERLGLMENANAE